MIENKIDSTENAGDAKRTRREKFWRVRNDDGTPNNVLLAGVVVALLIIVWVAWFVIGEIKMADSRLTKISNLWRYGSGMSDISKDSIYAMLYSAIQVNMPEGEEPPHRGAKVRKNSYTQKKVEDAADGNNVWHSEFIVDIAKLKQSYKISVDWPLGGMTIFSNYYPEVSCLSGDEVIYEDFVCKEPPERFPGEKSDPLRYLPYTVMNSETGQVKYSIRLNQGWLMIYLQTCGDAEKTEEYQKLADDWLENTEMELDKYQRRYIETCDGGF